MKLKILSVVAIIIIGGSYGVAQALSPLAPTTTGEGDMEKFLQVINKLVDQISSLKEEMMSLRKVIDKANTTPPPTPVPLPITPPPIIPPPVTPPPVTPPPIIPPPGGGGFSQVERDCLLSKSVPQAVIDDMEAVSRGTPITDPARQAAMAQYSSPSTGCFGSSGGTTSGGYGVCSAALKSLLGEGCHQMSVDPATNKPLFCDGPMSKSAKEGDAQAQPGCGSYGGGGYPTGTTPPPVSGYSCDANLVALLGTGCHQMFPGTYCNGEMNLSAKQGDAKTTPGCSTALSQRSQPFIANLLSIFKSLFTQ